MVKILEKCLCQWWLGGSGGRVIDAVGRGVTASGADEGNVVADGGARGMNAVGEGVPASGADEGNVVADGGVRVWPTVNWHVSADRSHCLRMKLLEPEMSSGLNALQVIPGPSDTTLETCGFLFPIYNGAWSSLCPLLPFYSPTRLFRSGFSQIPGTAR